MDLPHQSDQHQCCYPFLGVCPGSMAQGWVSHWSTPPLGSTPSPGTSARSHRNTCTSWSMDSSQVSLTKAELLETTTFIPKETWVMVLCPHVWRSWNQSQSITQLLIANCSARAHHDWWSQWINDKNIQIKRQIIWNIRHLGSLNQTSIHVTGSLNWNLYLTEHGHSRYFLHFFGGGNCQIVLISLRQNYSIFKFLLFQMIFSPPASPVYRNTPLKSQHQ